MGVCYDGGMAITRINNLNEEKFGNKNIITAKV